MESDKKILFYRNDKVYQSYQDLEDNVMYHNYNGSMEYDKGSGFIMEHDLKDGEPIIFRYKKLDKEGNFKISNIYGIVYRLVDNPDPEGFYRNISFFKSYDDFLEFYVIKEDFSQKPKPEDGFSVLHDININEDADKSQILETENYILLPDSSKGITFTSSKDTKNVTNISINGPKNTDTKYYAGNGVTLTRNNFTLNDATTSIAGGVTTSSTITSPNGFLKCPIKDGYAYYEKDIEGQTGNDSKINLYANRSGWFRIAESKEIDNYGIFTVSANYMISNRVQSSTITFVATYNSNDEVCLTEIAYGDIRPSVDIPKPSIEEIRVKYSNTATKIAFVDVYINVLVDTNCRIEIDTSNLRGWSFNNLVNDTQIMPLDVNEPYKNFYENKLDKLKNNSIKSHVFYQGEKNGLNGYYYRVIDRSNFATSDKDGIIKLKDIDYTGNKISFLELDNNNRAYIYAPKESTYILKAASQTERGGIVLVPGNASNIAHYDSNNPEHLSYKIPLASQTTLGHVYVYPPKRTDPDLAMGIDVDNTLYPVITNVSDYLCVRTQSTLISTATNTLNGIIKMGANDFSSTIKSNTQGNYYPVLLDKNERACVKIPTIINSNYVLPVANKDSLGGIKLGAPSVNESYIDSVKPDDGQYVYPVFLDNKNKAYVSVTAQGQNTSEKTFVCTVDNFELFMIMLQPGHTSAEGLEISNYRRFIIYNKRGGEIEYYIHAFTNSGYDCITRPLDVVIYFGYGVNGINSGDLNLRLYPRNYNASYNVISQNLEAQMNENGWWKKTYPASSTVRVHIQNVVYSDSINPITTPTFCVNCEEL